ncbi:CENP-B N-terminal DNA-binding domain [Popillia japonica]|uniref:CENP-B N-terminal DNA-binding domain n=1 Tax=Popillia japonica TaxID=7064 RepID=A0AAW1MED5_POPJA
MTTVFHQLLQNEAFVDVTLACNDLSLKAHKVVLSACSSYFQKLLLENPCKHPTIIMPQDICYADLKFIIEFVYKGEIDVSQAELQSLLKTADQLKIKGLCESPEEKDNSDQSPEFAFGGRGYPKLRKLSSPKQFKQTENHRKHKYRKPERKQSPDQEDKENKDASFINHSSDEENDMPVALDEESRKRKLSETITKPINMTSHGPLAEQFGVDNDDFPPEPPAPTAIPVGNIEMHEHSPTRTLLTNSSIHRTDLSDSHKFTTDIKKEIIDIKFETLRSYDGEQSILDMEASRMSGADHSMDSHDDNDQGMHTMMITPDMMGIMPGSGPHTLDSNCGEMSLKSNGHTEHTGRHGGGPKTWTQEDMELALDALKNHNMSLTKASATYGIPSTTLWQRAHRLGIDTPKKEGPTKSWTEESLNSALEALRTGTISANKASKAYGIPSSTLYKIARREGIRLAAPFNAAPTTWTPEDLEKALESIRSGQTSVQKASTEFGIPTGTLYGRCKREGIELSRSNPTPWSEDAMGEALEAVRLGHMSINQAAIHYNLPYSSLYGRFKRGIKYETENLDANSDSQSHLDAQTHMMDYSTNSHQQINYQQHPSNS